jgi:lipoprotein NlpI
MSCLLVGRTLGILLAGLLSCAFAVGAGADARKRAVTAPGFAYSIEPVPAWVVPARESPQARVDRAALHYRVIDHQRRVDDKGATAYHHVVRVVNEATGLTAASQVEVDFDPTCQTLAWHHIDIVRDGKRLGKLDRRRIKLLQRETGLERQIYDGRVTASVVLDDVRVGDQIDFAYSIRGSNPVFEGRLVDIDWLMSFRGPVALYQHRLLAPATRNIRHRAGSADTRIESRVERGMRETVFRREAIPQFHVDTQAPYSVMLQQELEFSEFDDWADVARWGQRLFAAVGADSAALDRKAAEIRDAAPDPEKRLLAALRFVQSEVRYLGTEIGLNSHRPASPEKVLEQRFGDCKDKVGLLVALLRRLDIAAAPVLVSTTLHGRVDGRLPSPLAFDHVIARVELNGATHWLDATRNHQSGDLPARQAVGFDKGLALMPGAAGLVALPTAYSEQRMLVEDTFRVSAFPEAVALESRVTYRGELADWMRETLATRGGADIETQLAAPYARLYPKLGPEGPMRVESSTTDDAVTLVRRFSIPDFWRFPDQRLLVADVAHWSVVDALRVPTDAARRDPYAFAFPGVYRHVTVLEYPEDVFSEPSSSKSDDGDAHFTLHTRAQTTARRTEYASEVRLLTDQLQPGQWSAYVGLLNKLSPRMVVTATVSALPLPAFESLKRSLKETDESVRARRIAVRTKRQYEALAKSTVLSAQIDAGRLAPALKAQALTARGIQRDHLGRSDEAQKDFAMALELVPEEAETQNAAAVNAVQRRDYDRARTLAAAVLARNPNDAQARNTRMLASYFMKDYAAARSDLDELLQDRAQVRRGYPIVWLSIAARRAAQDTAQALSPFADDQLPADWPRPLVDWARGKASVESLIHSAQAGADSAEHLCEAYFYIGERYMADGDTGRAAEFFQKAVDQGVTEFIEHASSRNRLALLKPQ